MGPQTRTAVRIGVLGPTVAQVGGEPVVLGGPKQRGVLAMLALAEEAPVSSRALAEGLWGGQPPPSASGTLRTYVSRLRALLGEDRLERSGDGWRLRLARRELDAGGFASLCREAAGASDPARCVALLERALALWRGEVLSDVAALPFARPAIARLEEARLAALEDRLDAVVVLGRHVAVLPELSELVLRHPLRERLAGAQMLALYRAGRQAESLQAYARLRRALADELGMEPGATLRDLHAAVLAQDPALEVHAGRATASLAPSRTPEWPAGNLAEPLSSLVGRRAELDAVADRLATARLVTLTGPGGVGKTRLALEVARRRPPADGAAWWVDLAALDEATLVPNVVAQALGVVLHGDRVPADVLADALRSRPLLVVLDNCEHVVAGAADCVAALLTACPRLRVLATSREPLGLPGEALWPVPPLPAGSRDSDAVQLFAERAAAASPGFVIDETTSGPVRRICRELDGLPLALELAAAKVRVLSLSELVEHLDDRFDLLTRRPGPAVPARHATLRATVAWSMALLDDRHAALFKRLSVFRGGFERDAVEWLLRAQGADPPTALDGLTALVDKSLVVAQPDTAPRRYHLLQTLREYGAGLLEPAAREALASSHAEWSATLAEHEAARLRGADSSAAWRRLDAERGNLRAALAHGLRNEPGASDGATTALRIATALSWYWYRRGNVDEGRSWLRRALQAAPDAPDGLRAHASLGAATLAYLAGDGEGMTRHLGAAVSGARRAGASDVLALGLVYSGYYEAMFGDPTRVAALVEEGHGIAVGAGLGWIVAEVSMTLAQLSRAQQDPVAAARHAAEGVAQADAVGHRWAAGSCRWIAAKAALDRGAAAEACALLLPAVAGLQDDGDRSGTLVVLHTLAAALAERDRPYQAAELLGAVDAAGERIGFRPQRMDPVDSPRNERRVRQALSPADFAVAYTRGRGRSIAEALALGDAAARSR